MPRRGPSRCPSGAGSMQCVLVAGQGWGLAEPRGHHCSGAKPLGPWPSIQGKFRSRVLMTHWPLMGLAACTARGCCLHCAEAAVSGTAPKMPCLLSLAPVASGLQGWCWAEPREACSQLSLRASHKMMETHPAQRGHLSARWCVSI